MNKKEEKKLIELDMFKEGLEEIIEVSETQNYFVKAEIKAEGYLEKTLVLKFIKSDIEANIDLKVVINAHSKTKLMVKVVTPRGIKNISSQLLMRALVINPESSIEFVPVLEIGEMDVSVDHKSTIGSPDREWLWYMESRGINIEQGAKIIAESFLIS